jgi:hypothetical protein
MAVKCQKCLESFRGIWEKLEVQQAEDDVLGCHLGGGGSLSPIYPFLP